MNPSYPSPEDSNLVNGSTQIEQRLKQLQPCPVNFNAETILDAAREAEGQVPLSERTTRERNERPARWIALSAACVCGAVAGSLLTSLVLLRADTGDSAIEATSKPRPKVDTVAKSDNSKGITEDSPREDSHPDYQWSDSDRLVSAQLLEMGGPGLTDKPPLMAGNYVLRSTLAAPRLEHVAVREPGPPADLPISNGHSSEESNPTRSIDRKQLLDELLGFGYGSRL